MQCFSLRHWIGTQKRGIRTGPNGLCGDRNTDCLSLSDALLFPLADRRSSLDSPRTLLHSLCSAHFTTKKKPAGSRDHLETLTVVHLVPIAFCVTEDRAALLSSQAREAGPCSKSDEYPHPDNPATRSVLFFLILCFRASQYKSNETPT